MAFLLIVLGIDELLDCFMDWQSLVFVDGSSSILIAIESSTDDIRKGEILPVMNAWNQIISSSSVPFYNLMIYYNIILSICRRIESQSVYVKIVTWATIWTVVVIARFYQL